MALNTSIDQISLTWINSLFPIFRCWNNFKSVALNTPIWWLCCADYEHFLWDSRFRRTFAHLITIIRFISQFFDLGPVVLPSMVFINKLALPTLRRGITSTHQPPSSAKCTHGYTHWRTHRHTNHTYYIFSIIRLYRQRARKIGLIDCFDFPWYPALGWIFHSIMTTSRLYRIGFQCIHSEIWHTT